MTNYIRSPNVKRRDDLPDEATIVASCCLDLQLAGYVAVTEVSWTQLVQLFKFDGSRLEEPLPERQRIDLLVLEKGADFSQPRPRMVVEFKKNAALAGLEADILRVKQVLQAPCDGTLNILGLQVLTVALTHERRRNQISEMVERLSHDSGLLPGRIPPREFDVNDQGNGNNVVFCGVYTLPLTRSAAA